MTAMTTSTLIVSMDLSDILEVSELVGLEVPDFFLVGLSELKCPNLVGLEVPYFLLVGQVSCLEGPNRFSPRVWHWVVPLQMLLLNTVFI